MTGNECAPEERSREGRCGVFILLFMDAVPVPGGGSFSTASERSEHRWVWVGGEPVRRVGLRIMSGGNTALNVHLCRQFVYITDIRLIVMNIYYI